MITKVDLDVAPDAYEKPDRVLSAPKMAGKFVKDAPRMAGKRIKDAPDA